MPMGFVMPVLRVSMALIVTLAPTVVQMECATKAFQEIEVN